MGTLAVKVTERTLFGGFTSQIRQAITMSNCEFRATISYAPGSTKAGFFSGFIQTAHYTSTLYNCSYTGMIND